MLIPCASGEKRPAFEYKDDLWSWDKFDEVMRERGAQELVQERGTKGAPQLVQVDWAIVLRDLCVIDCDSPEVSCPTRNPTQTPTPNPTLNPSSSPCTPTHPDPLSHSNPHPPPPPGGCSARGALSTPARRTL